MSSRITPGLIALLVLLATACARPAPAPSAPPEAPPATSPEPTRTAEPATAPEPPKPPVTTVNAVVERSKNPQLRQFSLAFASEQIGWLANRQDLFATADGGHTWQRLYAFDHPILTMDLHSPAIGWVATNKGLFATRDGGKSWEQLLGDSFLYGRFQFITEKIGWAAVFEKGLLATKDGGRTWTKLEAPCVGLFHFVNERTGWQSCGTGGGAGIETKQVHRSDDGGKTWRVVAETGTLEHNLKGNMPLSSYQRSLFFLDVQHGWLGTAKGDLLVTHDGGDSWTGLNRMGDHDILSDIQFFTPQRGIMVLTQHYKEISTLLATEDGGKTWRAVYPLEPKYPESAKLVGGQFWVAVSTVADPGAVLMRDVAQREWRKVGVLKAPFPFDYVRSSSFTDRQNGWVAIDRYEDEKEVTHLFRTRDGGATWTEAGALPGYRLEFLEFVDANTGYAAELNGVMLKTTDGGRTFRRILVNGVSGLRFTSPTEGWVIENRHLMSTADGAETWREIPTPAPPFALDLAPDGRALIFTGGVPPSAELHGTINGGQTWTHYVLPGVQPAKAKLGAATGEAWIWDVQNRLFRTTDGGQTWTEQ